MKKPKATKSLVETTRVSRPIVLNPGKVQIHLLYDSANPLYRLNAAAFTTAQGKPNRKEIRRFIDSRIAASHKIK